MTREEHLTELGQQVAALCGSMPKMIQDACNNARNPVALDKFALQATSVSQALAQLGERAQQQVESLLDEADEAQSG